VAPSNETDTQRPEVVVADPAPPLPRNSHHPEVLRLGADADRENEPPAPQHRVDGGKLLGQDARIAQRQGQPGDAYPGPLEHGAYRCGRGDALEEDGILIGAGFDCTG
jgi:hypothetical protein